MTALQLPCNYPCHCLRLPCDYPATDLWIGRCEPPARPAGSRKKKHDPPAKIVQALKIVRQLHKDAADVSKVVDEFLHEETISSVQASQRPALDGLCKYMHAKKVREYSKAAELAYKAVVVHEAMQRTAVRTMQATQVLKRNSSEQWYTVHVVSCLHCTPASTDLSCR